MQRTLNEVFII